MLKQRISSQIYQISY